jgi:choline dehydrogenase-like flavoprotein
MGTSRRNGVVDPDCRVHDLRNLFIAGSAVFPTSGQANPTLTIVALALRLADRLKRHFAPQEVGHVPKSGGRSDLRCRTRVIAFQS